MKYIYCLLIVTCLSAPNLSFSQKKPGAPHLGIGWTGLLYQGDLTMGETDYLRVYPGSNIFLQFANERAFRLRFSAGFGKIVEQVDQRPLLSEESRQTNNYFETNLFYFDLKLMRYFFRKGPVQPYLGFGPSLFFFNPKDQDGNFLIDNIFTREVGEEFATTIFVWPATVGLSFPLSKALRINADYTYRLNMSDYIDNIGLLGQAPGGDQLHAFQVSFDVRLGIDRKERSPEIEEEKPLKSIILASGLSKQSLSPKRKLSYRNIEEGHHKKDEQTNKLALDHILYYEMPEKERLTAPQVYAPTRPVPTNEKLETYYRDQLKPVVLEKKLYRKVKNTGILSPEAVAESHHLSLEELRQLNPDLPSPIPHGYELLLPDWEAAMSALEK